MKLLILSDIHGFTEPLEQVLDFFDHENCSHILFLGDALYHGPSDAFDDRYDAAATADLLNRYKDRIVAVRGNCDSEVDQMVLSYPMMSDYHIIMDENRKIFMTHGHLFSIRDIPLLKKGDIFANGHSHVAEITEKKGIWHFNPGSISLPRNNTVPSFGLYRDSELKILALDGEVLQSRRID